ncbi:MAG: A/G-specific adenine glycosylase, partial [Solirubrobacteraceae bacterium]|nr:A/G-specific adenine glycosylase [Solirubrobacteraceae bacterium]
PLPWRATRDPYALLVSEVMLQQTQAARVVPRYEAFLARFPTAVALAAAPPAEVLEEWSGLGYNRRALALQAAARAVAERGWPEDLTELPGVGAYTDAAVASFAWDAPRAAVDTNVRRVISRFDGIAHGPAELARRAAEVMPAGGAATHNQAMMELGATVCRPRRPGCGECPISNGCASRDRVPAAPASRRSRSSRFEDTDRWARGRILAALLAGAEAPRLEPERRARAEAGLLRDGLAVRRTDGALAPP